MIPPKVFEKHELDTDSLKAKFTAKKKDKKVENLIRVIRDRVNDQRRRQLNDHRTWAAVDLAYDTPFAQSTPTLVRHVLSTCHTAKDVMTACRSWGLNEGSLFAYPKDEDGNPQRDEHGNARFELNAPVFFNVFVPVVRAYVTVRLAKLFNDRNLIPLHKYEPQKYTSENRILCEIVTDIVQAMTAQFGYAATLRQVIFQSLLYSLCLMFPCESWYTEEHEAENGEIVTDKEGVRYVTPHITRMGWDLQYPLATLNTNTGCSFAFYWGVMRYGDLAEDEKYWNTKSVTYGYNWMSPETGYANYFKQAYPCVLELPTGPDPKSTQRDDAALTYSESDYDKGVIKTEMFMRINPKQWGLGDGKYEQQTWFRFTLAADDVIIYAEAFPYSPVLYCGYDADQNRAKNASFALEILPWQDHLGNVLTQILLTIKRNLANVIFYDGDQIDDNELNLLKRRNQWQYQELNFIPFSGLKNRVAQRDVSAATHEVKFSYASTGEMTQTIGTLINVMERLLGISPQEVGGQASHQQSKAEVVITQGNTDQRVTFTGTFVDDFQDAWKQQSYDAARAFRNPDFSASVSTDIPDLETHLKKLGFKTKDKTTDNRKVIVEGKLDKLNVEQFASTREGPDRGNDTEAAQAEYLAIQSINNNPMLAQMVAPESIIELIESAARKAGADRDFHVRVNKQAPVNQQIQEAMQQAEQAITQKIMQSVQKEFIEPAAKQMGQVEQAVSVNAQKTDKLVEIVAKLQEMVANAIAAPPLPPPGGMGGMPPPGMPPGPPPPLPGPPLPPQLPPGPPPGPPLPPLPPLPPPPNENPALAVVPGEDPALAGLPS